jgi:hypothetical protein
MERKFDAKVFRNLSLESVCDAEDTWKKVSHANLSPPEVSRQVAGATWRATCDPRGHIMSSSFLGSYPLSTTIVEAPIPD